MGTKQRLEREIGERLARLRIGFGLSQDAMAERLTNAGLPISREVLNHWERGTRHIKADHLAALSKIMGVSADYLLGLSDAITNDITVKQISEYTGIDADNVEMFHNLNVMDEKNKAETGSNRPPFFTAFNSLFRCSGFVRYFLSVLEINRDVQEIEKHITAHDLEEHPAGDAFITFNEMSESLGYLIYKLSNASIDMANQITGYKTIASLCEAIKDKHDKAIRQVSEGGKL